MYVYRTAVGILVLYPHDSMADWELGLPAMPSITKIFYCMLLA